MDDGDDSLCPSRVARFAGLVALFRLFEISPRMSMALDQVNEPKRLNIGEV